MASIEMLSSTSIEMPPTDGITPAMPITDRASIDPSGIDSLMRWHLPDAIPEEAVALMLAHPAMPKAVRIMATEMLAVLGSDKAAEGLFKDGGRYVAAISAIYLHATGGLTLPKLKAMCAASGLLSPGRARALLSFMRYLKYLAPAPVDAQSGPTRYVPTESLLAVWRDHLRRALNSVAVIEPAVALVRDRLDDPDVLNRFSIAQVEGLMISTRTNVMPAFNRAILQRHAGMRIMFSMLSVEDDDWPPRKPMRFSIAAAARRFGVSRIHIRRLLDEAQSAGLLICTQDGMVQFAEDGRTAVRLLYPVQLIRLLNAAAQTIKGRPDLIGGEAGPGAA